MAKENWSARIEANLKKDLQEFIKHSNYNNEDIVINGFEVLKNLQGKHSQNKLKQTYVNTTTESFNQNVFEVDNFDINLFEEINIANLNRINLQDMLVRISFWKPYNTLLKMTNGRYLFIKSVDQSIDEITFDVIGEELESVISLQRIINEVENISRIFERKAE